MKLLLGDCLEQMRKLPARSVAAVVTDPPYGLSFMNKHWDYDVPSKEVWREVLRVLKPGGHLLSFGGTRTYHRMVVQIEDAGFEIRDQIQWIYGSGFPKSHDISKSLDKRAGAKRKVIGEPKRSGKSSRAFQSEDNTTAGVHFDSQAATAAATLASGWGTALKPANEPIVLARRPFEGTQAQNARKWRNSGGLNIDASRIGTEEQWSMTGQKVVAGIDGSFLKGKKAIPRTGNSLGRWPANVLFDDTAAQILDAQSGFSKSAKNKVSDERKNKNKSMFIDGVHDASYSHHDSGGASRFFYVAKTSKAERNRGMDGHEKKVTNLNAPPGTKGAQSPRAGANRAAAAANHHPTVKPIKLMEYLIRLITPLGGIVLDPFMGSGSTGVAALGLGFDFIGIERDKDYFAIAEKRINACKTGK
jgi:DNA modification methylase